jgi:murein L,D-transpeptidase YcbB/YkuD
MGRKSLVCLSVAILAAFIISGCGTSQKKVQTEVTGIKTRVETLESRVEGVESKQAEVERLAAEQAQALEDMKSAGMSQAKTNISVKPREGARSEKMKDIQQALKNAGYYNGNVDGVKGKGTKRAIKEFQKANGLRADGVVGRKTWDLLSKHLSAAAPGSVSGDEGIK